MQVLSHANLVPNVEFAQTIFGMADSGAQSAAGSGDHVLAADQSGVPDQALRD